MATASTARAVSTHSGMLPSRVAGVMVDRNGTCSTRVSDVYRRVLLVTVPSGCAAGLHDRADAAGCGRDDGAAVLDPAQPRHRQLLVGHLTATEPGVVGRHGQQLRTGEVASFREPVRQTQPALP
jgi:hypothetical protein